MSKKRTIITIIIVIALAMIITQTINTRAQEDCQTIQTTAEREACIVQQPEMYQEQFTKEKCSEFEKYKEQCYYNAAVIRGTPELCKETGEMKESCITKTLRAYTGNKEPWIKEICKNDGCYYNYAINEKNGEYCKYLEDIETMDKCYSELGGGGISYYLRHKDYIDPAVIIYTIIGIELLLLLLTITFIIMAVIIYKKKGILKKANTTSQVLLTVTTVLTLILLYGLLLFVREITIIGLIIIALLSILIIINPTRIYYKKIRDAYQKSGLGKGYQKWLMINVLLIVATFVLIVTILVSFILLLPTMQT
ncbi:hypothetical protein COU61_04170 [Candidatus Pacearchaeota archaeon CG10_big_fil_rev_8_21_14_0_10_35_13]|nr:MAG: hypothetical protein COU61_04170 [Candidatus Pacearchaeota archaeon CG10_big_fil_rev_8_21_14_0_10_35_13]